MEDVFLFLCLLYSRTLHAEKYVNGIMRFFKVWPGGNSSVWLPDFIPKIYPLPLIYFPNVSPRSKKVLCLICAYQVVDPSVIFSSEICSCSGFAVFTLSIFRARAKDASTSTKKKSCKNYKPIDRENRDRHAFLSQQSVTTFRARVQGWRKKIDLKSQQYRGQKKRVERAKSWTIKNFSKFWESFFPLSIFRKDWISSRPRYLTSSSPIYVSPFGMFLCVASFKCNLQHHALMPLMQSCKQRLFVHFLISTKENFYADVQNG